MILLDTDIMTHWLLGQPLVSKRVLESPEDIATTVVSRIELRQGRFAYLLKAGDGPLLGLAPPSRGLLASVTREEDIKLLRAQERTGRPLGHEEFLATLEQRLGRILKTQKPGLKPPPQRTSKPRSPRRRPTSVRPPRT
jgi:hypothetical protein